LTLVGGLNLTSEWTLHFKGQQGTIARRHLLYFKLPFSCKIADVFP